MPVSASMSKTPCKLCINEKHQSKSFPGICILIVETLTKFREKKSFKMKLKVKYLERYNLADNLIWIF